MRHRMKNLLLPVTVGAAFLAFPAARTLQAQALRGVRGVGNVRTLPSERLGYTLGGYGNRFTTAQQFAAPAGGGGYGGYGPTGGVSMTSAWRPITWNANTPGPGVPPSYEIRFRTIDSLQFEKRARFAKLRESMLALSGRVRELQETSLGPLRVGLREWMFPFPLQDRSELGYGFFSRMDLVGSGAVDRELFLAPFTAEVQQSLGEARFLETAEALLFARSLPAGVTLDQFYDPQLAALGNYLFNNACYAAAADVWTILVNRDATSATRRRGLALLLLASRRLSQAATEARKSLTLAPGWPDNLHVTGSNLQDVFPNVNDLADAREELDAQLALKPDDADLNFLMAYMDLFQGKWSAAEERLARWAPQDEVAAHLLARLKAGAVDESVRRPTLSVLRRVTEQLTGLEEEPLSPEDRARLITVLQTGAESYEDHMRLGDFRFFMGEFSQADEEYRAAHKVRPEDPFSLFALVHAAFANGEYRSAIRYLEKAFALEPAWGLYEFRLQEFYGEEDEYRRQVADLERLVELRPTVADTRFLLAYVYYFSGRYADAADELAEVLHLQPDFARADQFLRLARLQG